MSNRRVSKVPLGGTKEKPRMVLYGQCDVCLSEFTSERMNQRYCRRFGDACARIGAARIRAMKLDLSGERGANAFACSRVGSGGS